MPPHAAEQFDPTGHAPRSEPEICPAPDLLPPLPPLPPLPTATWEAGRKLPGSTHARHRAPKRAAADDADNAAPPPPHAGAAKTIELRVSAVPLAPALAAPCPVAPPQTLLGWLASTLAWLYHRLSFLHNMGLFGIFTTLGAPTNQIMLAYRTVAQDLGDVTCNQDYLAADLRDQLMPVRGWVHRRLPLLLHIYRWFLQSAAFGCPGIVDFVDARTRWFDEQVQQALRSAGTPGGFKQVVVVAGGYDTRAYRMGYDSSVRFFEVDLPAASENKKKLVRSLGLDQGAQMPVYVGADLSQVPLDQALLGTGFNPSHKTLFTCEGLLYYLPHEAVSALLHSISTLSAPGSALVFDFIDQDVQSLQKLSLGYHALRLTVQNKGEPLRSGLSPDPEHLSRFLSSCGGLALQQLLSPKELAGRMLAGRPWSEWGPPLPPFFHYCVAEKW